MLNSTCTGRTAATPDVFRTVMGLGMLAGTASGVCGLDAPEVGSVLHESNNPLRCLFKLSATACENMPRSSGIYCFPAIVP